MTEEEEQQKIKDKIRKLLALTESDNINEAAAAAERAQALIDQHHIDVAMLDDTPDDEEVVMGKSWVCFTVKKKTPSWKNMLIWAIAEVNDCSPLSHTDHEDGVGYQRHHYVVGRPTDCQHVQTMYQFIESQVEYLVKKSKGRGKAWNNSFRLGAVAEVGRRLKHARDERRLKLKADAKVQQAKAPESHALVRVETALQRLEQRAAKVQDFLEFHEIRYRSKSARSSGGGFGAGRSAGASISLGGGGQKALK